MTMDYSEVDPLHELHGHVDQALRVAVAGGLQMSYMRGIRDRESLKSATVGDKRQQRTDLALAQSLWSRAFRDEWWDQATPEQIARSYQASLAYATAHPGAADALVRIDKEVNERFGLTQSPPGTVVENRGEELDRDAVTTAENAGRDVAIGHDERMDRYRSALGPEHAEKVLGSSGWEALEARLEGLEARGVDSAAALGRAVTMRSLDGAKDVARVLAFRLSPTANKAADAGAGVEAENVEVARLINDSLKGNRERPAGSAKGSKHDAEPWMAKDRTHGTERGLGGPQGGPQASPER
jgi:hypothetical protein